MLELKNIHKTFNPGTINEKVALNGLNPVSYTHLDVYKRQFIYYHMCSSFSSNVL